MPADVWGLGVILFQMATLNLPFECPDNDRTLDAEDITKILFLHQEHKKCKLDLPKNKFSSQFKDLLDGIFRLNPFERLTID